MIIDRVEVYPLADGGIMLRFAAHGDRLEIEVDADGDATCLNTPGAAVLPPEQLAGWFGLTGHE